jgi:superfamily II DNA or RNA helicase
MNAMDFSKPGTLVHARGREWVVLPGSSSILLHLKPLGGLDEEVTGILPSIEKVESAQFGLPAADDVGDFVSGRLLRDAALLSTRASAGPFRSFGRIAIEPRPYQLVPLIMALRMDPVRLLIADDVGIGKTIEASLIVREFLDRGEIRGFTVLCPPHLAEQWQLELSTKFHIDAELVLSSTIKRLERDLPIGKSVFDRYPFTIVSTDFIKTAKHAHDFLHKCPEFVIVDEAHGCAASAGVGKSSQQRFELIRQIAADKSRHLVLVTATPHSGNEEAFRSLLSLLKPEFADLPIDLEREERTAIRKDLARHLVQRRRADIRHYIETDTAFPERLDKTSSYTMHKDYRALLFDVLDFAAGYVKASDGERRRRVRYWSALALLRCVSSSPAAAAATLRSRAAVDEAEEINTEAVGRQTVLDQGDSDDTAPTDIVPGSNTSDSDEAIRRKLHEFALRAEGLPPGADEKLQSAIKEIKQLIKENFRPVIFCRFVDTAEYVAQHLRDALGSRVAVEVVTGLLPASEREARIAGLVTSGGKHALVCTDCLSEGVNLQHYFDAVFHYDLAWNPTRHEQREGRVDRFGQQKPEVRVVTFHGKDNPIDGVILDVLIRKHKAIKSDLGVTVAVPRSSNDIAEALFEAALFRERVSGGAEQLALKFIDELEPNKTELHAEWDNAREREKVSRSRFAQHALDASEVAAELEKVRRAIGRSSEVARFVKDVLHSAGVPMEEKEGALAVHIRESAPRALRQAIARDEPFVGRFDLPLAEGEYYLGRTSPLVEGLAGWVIDQALDRSNRDSKPVAARCGFISTSSVVVRTTLLVVRFRFHLKTVGQKDGTILCEEIATLACKGASDSPEWLSEEDAEKLLSARAEANLLESAIKQQIDLLKAALPKLRDSLAPIAKQRAVLQLDTHEKIRQSLKNKGSTEVEPVLPVDILGAYVLMPKLPT